MAVGASSLRSASSSNSTTLSISAPMEMLVTRSRMNSRTPGNPTLLHQPLGFLEGSRKFLRLLHPYRLASHGLGHRNMIDAVARFRIARAVDVLESEADLEIHREAALRLPDQAEQALFTTTWR